MPVEVWTALLVFLLLCGCIFVAREVRPRLPAGHRERETIESLHLMITMLVTFAALVLGLLIASASSSYSSDVHDREQYSLLLAELDRCLADYGPQAAGERDIVRTYTAIVIATTWPNQKRPAGIAYPDLAGIPHVGESRALTGMLDLLYLDMRRLTPTDAFQAGVLSDCLAQYSDVRAMRRTVIWDDRAAFSVPFYAILTFWLMVVFTTLGLAAPPNRLSLAGMLLSAISLSLAVFVISDLDHPYGGGLFSIPSDDMRAALAQMMALRPN